MPPRSSKVVCGGTLSCRVWHATLWRTRECPAPRVNRQTVAEGKGLSTEHNATSTQAIDVSPYHASRLLEGVVPSKPQVAFYSDAATYGSRRVIVEDDSFDFSAAICMTNRKNSKVSYEGFRVVLHESLFFMGSSEEKVQAFRRQFSRLIERIQKWRLVAFGSTFTKAYFS